MALNINTDPQFDEALTWLAQKEHKTKSDIVRELVLAKYRGHLNGFEFGALPLRGRQRVSSVSIQKQLKELDHDHDLD